MTRRWARATPAIFGAVAFTWVTTGCTGETLATEDCAQEVRFGGAVYSGYHVTAAQAEREGTAEWSECDDQGSTARGAYFGDDPDRVTVWSFAGHSPDDVLGVRFKEGSFAVFVARSLTTADRDRILDELRNSSPSVTVYTTLAGPEVYYIEGALAEIVMAPAGTENARLVRTSEAQPVGTTTTWDVTRGVWTLTAATRPCGGSCDNLDPPSDVCTADFEVTRRTRVHVIYHWGRPCTVQALAADETVVAGRPGQAPERIIEALNNAGLEVVLQQEEGSADCPTGRRPCAELVNIEPDFGTVLPTGSAVTLTVREGD